MKKFGTDPKVKKTLVRNYEEKAKSCSRNHDEQKANSNAIPKQNIRNGHTQNENELGQPSLCSSEVLANYLTDVTKNLPLPQYIEDNNIDKEQINAKMTKKLNIHFNEKLYKNLVELNVNAEVHKTRKDRKPLRASTKRDLEPNIEDFCQDEKEKDLPPAIPVPPCKFKPIKKVENGQLHKLIASFEKL
ncbi:hypothetical protein RR48_10490 [Papilio machaon]|uniref:Protein phosphatase 1 regulatory subunit 35 C-terminal domain-containing protein n=1 Tax=Papilio machaon TaxID=76193 RepID=A0A194R6J3_PAPMA|nr:hypothetical protein RR48_10490 [Papilio machaon]